MTDSYSVPKECQICGKKLKKDEKGVCEKCEKEGTFNLSERIRDLDTFLEYEDVIPKKDVKEFIRRLKEELSIDYASGDWNLTEGDVMGFIDKLAGEDL